MLNSPRERRQGFTLLELLVTIAVIAALIGMLLPAVQRVRQAAARVQCQNTIKQLSLACHHADQTLGHMPPGLGYDRSKKAFGTIHFFLLPYLEQQSLYQQSFGLGYHFVGNNQVYAQPVKAFICPMDPSAPQSGTAMDVWGNTWGVSSYAANAQVFCTTQYDGQLVSGEKHPKLENSFTDGTSQTMIFTEKYAQCYNAGYPAGGNFWGFFFNTTNLFPYHPGVTLSWNSYSYGPASKFLVQPNPYNGNCDPTMSSSPHPGGIQIAMADGSVRFLSADVNNYTWWYLCTPQGDEVITTDLF